LRDLEVVELRALLLGLKWSMVTKNCERSRKMKLANYLLLGLLAAATMGMQSCPCMEVPPSDDIPPGASLSVIGGLEDMVTVNTFILPA
jgi:hypothetical protein